MEIGRVLNLTVRAYSGGASSVLMGLSYAISDIAMKGRSMSLAFVAIGAVMMAAGGVIIGALKGAVENAIEFDAHMRRILALTETLPENFGNMKDKILEMTRTIPKSANEMADALYFIKSVVADDTVALQMLEIAAKAASLEMSSTEPVAKTLSAAYIAYGWTIDQVRVASDQLTQAVSEGRAEYADFSTQMGQLIGTGASLGISFKEMSVWMAFLTRRGYSAANSAVLLKNVMQKIMNPTKAAVGVYKKLGIEFGALAVEKAGGLIPYLGKLGKATNWNIDTLRKLFPGLRQLPLLLNMARDAAKGDASELKKLDKSISNVKVTLEERFQRAVAGAKAQLILFKNAITEASIRIGQVFLPILVAVLKPIRDLIVGVSEWMQKNPEAAASFAKVTAAVGVFLLLTGGLMIILGLFRMMAGIFGPVILVAVGLALAIPPLVQWLDKLWAEVKKTDTLEYMRQAFVNLGESMKVIWDTIRTTWALLGGKTTDFPKTANSIEDIAKKISEASLSFNNFVKSDKFREWVRKTLEFVMLLGDGLTYLKDNMRSIIGVVVGVGVAFAAWKIGAEILALAGVIVGIVDGIGLFIGVVQGLASGAIVTGEAMGILGTGAGALAAIVTAVLAMSFWEVVAVIAIVIGAIVALYYGIKNSMGFIINAVKMFKDMFIEQFRTLMDSFGPLWESLVELFNLLKPVLVVLGVVVGSFVALALGFFVALASGIVPLLSGIIRFVTGVINFVVGIVQVVVGIIQAIAGAFSGNQQWVDAAEAMIEEGGNRIAQGLMQMFDGLKVAILGTLQGIGEGIVRYFLTLAQSFGVPVATIEGIMERLGMKTKVTNDAMANATYHAKAAAPAFAAIGTSATGALGGLGGYSDALGRVRTGVQQVRDIESQMLQDRISSKAAHKAYNDAVAEHGKRSDEAQLALRRWKDAQDAAKVSDDANKKRIEAAAKQTDQFKTKMDALARKDYQGAAFQSGANLTAGFARGILSKGDIANAAATKVGGAALRKLNQVLDNGSPSRLAAKAGAFLTQGLAIGMIRDIGLVNAASTALARAAMPDVSLAGMGGLSSSYTTMTKQEVVHKVEFGKLPDGLKLEVTGAEVAALLLGDKTALTDVAREVQTSNSKDIR